MLSDGDHRSWFWCFLVPKKIIFLRTKIPKLRGKADAGVTIACVAWRAVFWIQAVAHIDTLDHPQEQFLHTLNLSTSIDNANQHKVRFHPIYGYQVHSNQIRQPDANTKSKTVPITEFSLFITISGCYSTRIITGNQPKVRFHPLWR